MESSGDKHQHTLPAQPWSQHAGSYAFLNHSSTTLPNNLPPSVDDKPLARQKRRRTSPEDQAVLEAAYSRDFKPDKAARLELVKQVALGEKEVQIWFQNRRQTSRRKSRPLLPHEIAQYHLAKSGLSDPASYLEGSPEPEPGVVSVPSSADIPNNVNLINDLQRSSTADSKGIRACSFSSPDLSQGSHTANCSGVPSHRPSEVATRRESVTFGFDGRPFVGHLANRRSAPSLRMDEPIGRHAASLPLAAQHQTACALKKSTSSVHLSLTSEGNAKVVTKDGSSPSPPRLPQLSSEHFGISGSQGTSNAIPAPHSILPTKPLQRTTSGRSRDSRTWEFYCDRETRGELEEKAEKDASGSAADAINLLRSTSGRRVLGLLSSRDANAPSKYAPSWRRNRLDSKSRLLHRSSTSLGRLQNNTRSDENGKPHLPSKAKAFKPEMSPYIPGNDSDKENWSPRSGRESENSREDSRVTVNESSMTLDELLRARGMGQRSKSHTSSYPTRGIYSSNADAENTDPRLNADPDADPEIAAFMRSAKSNSISEEEDLDCIQGLLSLSQGNWR